MASKKRILVLFAHPSVHRSEVNRPLFESIATDDSIISNQAITLVDLYQEYPTFAIDIEREQQRLREHDVIVFMFPLYWYSTPSILKEWQDLVLEYGFAYGSEGTELHDKLFLCVLTAGGAEKAYHADGYNHFTIRELLQPLEQMANITGMRYLPPFALFGARTALEDNRVPAHIKRWHLLITALQNERLNPDDVQTEISLNQWVDKLQKADS